MITTQTLSRNTHSAPRARLSRLSLRFLHVFYRLPGVRALTRTALREKRGALTRETLDMTTNHESGIDYTGHEDLLCRKCGELSHVRIFRGPGDEHRPQTCEECVSDKWKTCLRFWGERRKQKQPII